MSTQTASKKVIVFIDDDAFFSFPFVEELEETYDVTYFGQAQPGIEAIRCNLAIDAIVLDVMMPTPSGVASTATDGGLETGLWLLRQVKDLIIQRCTPVIILTNRAPSIVKQQVNQLEFPEGLITICTKSETPSFELPNEVKQLVASQAGSR